MEIQQLPLVKEGDRSVEDVSPQVDLAAADVARQFIVGAVEGDDVVVAHGALVIDDEALPQVLLAWG